MLKRMIRESSVGCLIAAMALLGLRPTHADEPILVKENGSWCWFQGQRAVVAAGKVFLTSIAGDDHGGWDAGDLVATAFDPHTKTSEHQTLHAKLQRDDHAVAGLCVLPDGRVMAVYGKHGNDHLQRWRSTVDAGDISRWTAEQTFDAGASYTYSNVYQLSGEDNRIYNFHRGHGYNPNCTVSDDGGASWRYGWRLLQRTRGDYEKDPRFTRMDGSRPYVCYASDGGDAIHFIHTDDHPRAYDNSLYHGYYQAGKLFASDGRVIGTPTSDDYTPPKPNDFTEVFPGDADHAAWACDVRVDSKGHPYVAFSVQVDGAEMRLQRGKGGMDHRYYYGRWDGAKWHVHPMAHAGSKLYSGEDDYTGLVALDPQDPASVVISTNADPQTGQPLISSRDDKRHWELYQGTTPDGGATWNWTALTRDSIQDQLRPVIPDWPDGPRVIFWARGNLQSYTNYHLDIVALTQTR